MINTTEKTAIPNTPKNTMNLSLSIFLTRVKGVNKRATKIAIIYGLKKKESSTYLSVIIC